MKVGCKACGCHFPEDFEVTMQPPCNFWGDIGMGNLPGDYKAKIWDWYFSLPVDEIAVKFSITIQVSLGGTALDPSSNGNEWKSIYPDYEKLSEEEQKDFQRQFFKAPDKVQFLSYYHTHRSLFKKKVRKVARA